MMNEIITKTKGFMHITATEGDVEYLMASCDTDGARAPLAALPCRAPLPCSLATCGGCSRVAGARGGRRLGR